MALPITITDAGRAEIINAQNTGTGLVTITEIGFGTGQYAPTKTQTALQAQVKRVSSIAGQAVAADTIHVMALDETSAAYNVGEFGLFSDKGTLIAVYSQPAASGWIIQKAGPSTLLLATDIILESLNATSITFGDISFINPPATTTVKGVVELATPEETQTGSDGSRAVTPAGLKSLTGSTTRAGLVQLNNTLTSTSTVQALTAAQGKKLQDEKLPSSRVQSNPLDTTADALLTVGSFGLGSASAPSESTDCNNLTRPGFYSIGGSAANRPSYATGSVAGMLVLAGGVSARCSQMYFMDPSAAVRVSVRHLTGSGWTPWQELFHSGNLSPVETSRLVSAGSGLTGGGSLAADRIISLGTPGTISGTTSNAASAESHTHALELPAASVTEAGIVQLNNTLASTSTSQALTAAQGKKLQDEKLPSSRVQSNPVDTTADALLTVGSFGLGSASAPSESTDCNNLTRPGFYTIGGSAANRPSYTNASASSILVLAGGVSARCSQMHFMDPSTSVRVSVRHLTGSGWTPWQELFHSGNLSPVETSRLVSAGNGLTGGGSLTVDRTISLGTPGTVSGATSNAVSAGSHTHTVAAASESTSGAAKVGTQAEVDAGSADNVIVSPKKLRWGFSALFNTQGYIAFPSWLGGFIVQWGSQVIAETAGDYALPIPFPNAFLQILINDGATASGLQHFAAEPATLSTYTAMASVSGNLARFIAFGR